MPGNSGHGPFGLYFPARTRAPGGDPHFVFEIWPFKPRKCRRKPWNFSAEASKIPIRCNKAQNTIISGNWIYQKIKGFQQSFPEASHSPQIVPRGTIWLPPLFARSKASPAQGSRRAFERTGHVRGDPAAVKIARLRRNLLPIDEACIDAAGVKRQIIP